MRNFVPISGRVYQYEDAAPAPGFLALLLTGTETPTGPITILDAWTQYVGYFIFLKEKPADLNAFAAAVEKSAPGWPAILRTSFAWATFDTKAGTLDPFWPVQVALQGELSVVAEDFTLPLRNYGVPFKKGSMVTFSMQEGYIDAFHFGPPEFPGFQGVLGPGMLLPVKGNDRFTLQGDGLIGDFTDDALTGWDVSLRFFAPVPQDQGASNETLLGQRYPLFQNPEAGFQVGFHMSWDPLDPTNADRTYLSFTGANYSLVFPGEPGGNAVISLAQDDGVIPTHLRTTFNLPIALRPLTTGTSPARLVFNDLPNASGQADRYYLAPAGEFELRLGASSSSGTTPKVHHLRCGLTGTEYFAFLPGASSETNDADTAGDILTFYPGQAAYAPDFPLAPLSLQGDDSLPTLLQSTYLTSYTSVRPGTTARTVPYFTEPTHSALFTPDQNTTTTGLLDFYPVIATVPSQFDAAHSFPMVPYAGLDDQLTIGAGFDPARLGDFESQILARARVNALEPDSAESRGRYYGLDDDAPFVSTTTPQGLRVDVVGDEFWQTIDLARNTVSEYGNERTYFMRFHSVDENLRKAFQTNEQFLVVTSPALKWTLRPDTLPPFSPDFPPVETGTEFNNLMSIEHWPFQVNTGEKQNFGDYRNVVLVKFRPGKLEDLVANPGYWSQPKAFNEQDELIAVSAWLQEYIANAKAEWFEQKNEYFEKIATIAVDPNWNGVLFLKVDSDPRDFPPALQGLLAGINLKNFYAHHLGIDLNFVTTEKNPDGTPVVEQSGNSSLFGLIYYVDPAYAKQIAEDPTKANQPVPLPQDFSGVYDFKVLTLKVLFKNTEIKKFSSKTQLTINDWFGIPVTEVVDQKGNAASSNSVVLDGSYENHNGQPVYVFKTVETNYFQSAGSNILNDTEVVKASFHTLVNQDHTDSSFVRSRFTLEGYFNFAALKNFDALSFGAETGSASETGQGLFFSNLFIDMDFAVSTPSARTFAFDTSQIAFDPSASFSRADSLFRKFPIRLKGLAFSQNEELPISRGFLTAIVENFDAGTITAPWFGLEFELLLGTPGDLVKAAGFEAGLLIAWSTPPASSPGTPTEAPTSSVSISVKLPGAGDGNAKFLTLEGVLKVDIGAIEFKYIAATDGKPSAYLMKFSDLVMKFLDFSFPPRGDTVFYLFGNPDPNSPRSSLGWYAVYKEDDGGVIPGGPGGPGPGPGPLPGPARRPWWRRLFDRVEKFFQDLISRLLKLFFGAFLFASVLSAPNANAENLFIHHFGIGQGDATLIEAWHKNEPCFEATDPDCTYILIDTGNSKRKGLAIFTYLMKSEVPRLDALITSHLHSDHYGGTPALLEALGTRGIPIAFIMDRAGEKLPDLNDLPYEKNNVDRFVQNDDVAPELAEPTTRLFARYLGFAGNYPDAQRIAPVPGLELFTLLDRQEATKMRFTMVAGYGQVLDEFGSDTTTDYSKDARSENDYSFAWILQFESFKYFTGGDIGGGGGYVDLETPLAKYFQTWPEGTRNFHFCAAKSSHHGSRHSTNDNFLKFGRPSYTVIPSALRSFSGTQIPGESTIKRLLAQALPGPTAPGIEYTYIKDAPPPWSGSVSYYKDVMLRLDSDPGSEKPIPFKVVTWKRSKSQELAHIGKQQTTSFTCSQPHPEAKALIARPPPIPPPQKREQHPTLLRRCLDFFSLVSN